MPSILRITLIILSFFTTWYVIRRIRKHQLQIEDSIFWISFSLLLIALSVFPSIVEVAAKSIGIMSPANFVFVFIIFLLVLKVFFLNVKLSAIEHKFQKAVQEYTIKENKRENEEEIKAAAEAAVTKTVQSKETE